jgi:type II secretory pathway predicted ATPase ExeA/septal ring-binding cell division protein DamX
MYLEHFGLNESPFRITPHTDFFFDGANRGATLDALIYAITHDEGIVKVSGEVGSGKTMLCRVLMERLPANVMLIYLANPSLSREDILYAIADELRLDIPDNARPSAVLRVLQNHLIMSFGEGRQVVVLIDEAHAMPAETLEEIRLLSNLETNRHKLLQLVLFGQPELNDILARPDMRQLKERITHNFSLEPLVRNDIASYLDFRMRAAGYRGPSVFSAAAVKLIERSSRGLTRRINILADKALLAAFSTGSHRVGAREAQAAIRDCDFSKATCTSKTVRKNLVVIGGGVLGASALITVVWLLAAAQTPAPGASISQPAIPFPARQAAPANASIAPSVSAPPSISQSVPQLAVGASNPTTVSVIEPQLSATPNASASTSVAPADAAPPSARLQPLARSRLEAGRLWLEQASDDHWFIQLFATEADRPQEIEAFLRKARTSAIDMNNVRVYYSTLSGKPRYGVIYGEYSTKTAAVTAMTRLPASVRAGKPYPRQVARLR